MQASCYLAMFDWNTDYEVKTEIGPISLRGTAWRCLSLPLGCRSYDFENFSFFFCFSTDYVLHTGAIRKLRYAFFRDFLPPPPPPPWKLRYIQANPPFVQWKKNLGFFISELFYFRIYLGSELIRNVIFLRKDDSTV